MAEQTPPCVFCGGETHLTVSTEAAAVYHRCVQCLICLSRGPKASGPNLEDVTRRALEPYQRIVDRLEDVVDA